MFTVFIHHQGEQEYAIKCMDKWHAWCNREDVDLVTTHVKELKMSHMQHRWLWHKYVDTDALLIDSDTIPTPSLSRQELQNQFDRIKYIGGCCVGDPLGYQRKINRLLPNLPFQTQLTTWEHRINNGVVFVKHNTTSIEYSKELVELFQKHKGGDDEVYSRELLLQQGIEVDILPERYNFIYLNGLNGNYSLEECTTIGRILHFAGDKKRFLTDALFDSIIY